MKKRTCFQKLIDINKILDSDLSHSEKLVLIKMSMYNDCYITDKQLATSLTFSIQSIKRIVASLKEKRVLKVIRTTKENSKMQQRKVTGIDFDNLNNNAVKLQKKNQSLISDTLLKNDVSEEQSLTSDTLLSSNTGDKQAQPRQSLHFSEQSLISDTLLNHEKPPTNSVTMPRVKLSEQSLTSETVYNNNNIINSKTIRYIIDTPTQKNQKRSEFSVNKSTNTTKKKKRFKKPTVEEIRQYCIERGNTIDPEYFYDWYASRGWFLSKGTHMVDWKASVRTWEYKAKKWKEEEEERKKKEIVHLPTGQAQQKYTQSWYDKDAELRKQIVMTATGGNHDK